MYGYPKKCAHVCLKKMEDVITGSIERNGITFFDVTAKIGEKHEDHDRFFPEHDPDQLMTGAEFHLDYKPTCFGGEHTPTSMWKFTNVQLLHTVTNVYHAEDVPCKVDIRINPSEDDPWYELMPKKILGAVYRKFTIRLMGNELDKEYTEEEAEKLMPYLYLRYDAPIFKKD